ncbi:fatty acid desaturase [Nonomuraea muscovyensis]|uniref:Fatty acid desaturase n=1 Tax=Nonomuraea muscovyensis TaxID=1124761 RepID=A0A7X0CEL3_9ACTN|nr:acyl-CoA desaturase [Nonomuraea muscovyensis]MBB6352199.1 fatty acid desaturase [Nonomuraea muscovyensis]
MTPARTTHPPAAAGERRGSDFARLSRAVAQAGLLDRRPGYYAVRAAVVAGLFAGGWAAFAVVGDSWWQIAVAVVLAVAFGQVALLSHDLAHGQVFRSRRAGALAGRLAGNLGIGLGYGWWQDKHTRHHANPNHEDHDPDVAPDVLVWSIKQAEASTGLVRFLGRWQAFLFFPLLTLEGVNLHVSSVRSLLRGDSPVRQRGLEGLLLFTHFAAYVGAVLAVLPLGKALVFMVVHQACFGVYLGCSFAPNHKGMPVLTAEDELDFLRKQVLTSRNVSGGRLLTAALGGLNYQIEHHLFPSMPTPNLRRARPLVREHCASLGVPYVECGLLASWGQALRHLHAVGAPLRRPSRPAAEPS